MFSGSGLLNLAIMVVPNDDQDSISQKEQVRSEASSSIQISLIKSIHAEKEVKN